MRLWLDDERKPPVGWHWVKTADECIEALKAGGIERVSLDHDLAEAHYSGDYSRGATGYHVATFLELNPEFAPKRINLHTLNPIGLQRMMAACKKLDCELTTISALKANLLEEQ